MSRSPRSPSSVATGVLDQTEPVTSATEAYETFDRGEPGWIEVQLDPPPPEPTFRPAPEPPRLRGGPL